MMSSGGQKQYCFSVLDSSASANLLLLTFHAGEQTQPGTAACTIDPRRLSIAHRSCDIDSRAAGAALPNLSLIAQWYATVAAVAA